MNSKFLFFYLVLFTLPLFGQNDIQVISSSRNELVVQYTPSYSDTSIVKINNQNYIKVGLRYGIIPEPEDWGMPAVPERIVSVGVPSETGNTVQIISTEYKTLNGNLAPKPEMVKDKQLNKFEYKIKSGYNKYKQNTELVSFGEYGMLRSIPVQVIKISPVVFDPGQSSIKMYTKIIFQINFATNQTIAIKPASSFLSGAIINYGVAKYWSKNENQSRLRKAVVNSVLSSGTWVRFETPAEGIYKITKTMLASYGIDPSTVDPRTIKIYNNGGKALPEDLNAPRPSDLQENAIMVVGEDDGKFDDGDYISFYGRGNDFWDFDSSSNTIKRYYHPYSNVNYYWITSGGEKGKRIGQEASISSPTYYNQTSTKAFAQLDEDKINIGKTGREYYGDNFSPTTTSRTYLTKLNGLLSNYTIKYNVRFINASQETVGLEVDENSTPIINQNLYGWGGNQYSNGVAYSYTASYNGTLPEDRSVLKFNFIPTTSSSLGYLDYFEILYQAQLQAVNDNLLFFSKDTTAAVQYNLSGFSSSNIQVFNVSDYANVRLITNAQISGGSCTFQTNETSGKVSKYFAVGSGQYLTPSNPVTMQNSNLHGIQTGAQYVIITNKIFDDAAERLAAYKENQAQVKYSTMVVNVDQIYNEFSCGMTDPTAVRDFLKYAYDNWQIKPEYVLLFGKGTYDAKDVEGYHQDFVPAYETQESLNQLSSYTSDDFYMRVSGSDLLIDIPYGRIPCATVNDADNAVDKIIQYETTQDKGLWRNLITLVADDDYTSDGYEGDYHNVYSENLSNNKIPGSFDQHKIYLGMYPVVLTGEGRRYPQVNKDIISAINNGTLIINYFGHGDTHEWAHEKVFEQTTSIPQLNNDKYFLLVAGTCDFGYWDNPTNQSAAEELVLLKNAGAIATFTSARLAVAANNETLVDLFFSNLLLSNKDSAGIPVTIGQAVLETKRGLYDD
ncbi:MAG TPA: type IX secretion system sortase PorU, partial [Ignavibacteriaceae bacterium]|nr:type IX secretion system sortase PorU [Ignavibacteriaceae bacterium]